MGMYWNTARLIEAWEGEKNAWPTWEELDAGLRAFRDWKDKLFTPPSPFWFLASKTVDEDSKTKYPNILAVRDWGRSKSNKSVFKEFTG